ncbi:TIGR03111 family XrtG-associated glycosyltransferase [Oenococcus oeni]|uniref:TIGR03111 family XrtG-associated glycosyltransferase n=1 Tax=Oenococcus oeni TaxID=1247 RepID=UPI0008F80BC1|nr:TIGR03111 family XrtG-associated glycosyltransferase [Oenococcus oeni]MDI4583581.1 putative glycosyltransferase, exosortase G system-associated [Oenococcus sp. UCMA 14587]OIM25342.1 putative glycosyltransferase, exosortase G system-associated [Oenococcus oeni]SYW14239.1 putative glycosyltransferase associated to biofilm formation [Oenococcus oeni]
MSFLDQAFAQMGFWITWMLIPIIFEIVPECLYFVKLTFESRKKNDLKKPAKLPIISIIVPVYNSEETLFKCLGSISDSSYPNKLMQVIVANNQSTDNSFQVFNKVQQSFSNLRLQWMNTDKGKAPALNSAIYNSSGKYIINLDSDGVLEKNALMRMVLGFENNSDIDAMTGTILTEKAIIQNNKKPLLRLLQNNEYFEYAQAFLSGRSIESSANRLFTMSGAFSAFRKEVLLKTYMYNTQTVGEDTDMTFQIRSKLKGRVALCTDSFFYVDPIESLDQLYIQRQRWQRGEIEVSRSFMRDQLHLDKFFKNFMVRRLMIDHTFVFPRMIWMFGIFVLAYLGYSPIVLLLSVIFMYLLYVFDSFLNFINVRMFLKKFDEERSFYSRKWWIMFTMPLYNLICSFIRLIGIINSITLPIKWKSKTFKEECADIKKVVQSDFKGMKDKKGNK